MSALLEARTEVERLERTDADTGLGARGLITLETARKLATALERQELIPPASQFPQRATLGVSECAQLAATSPAVTAAPAHLPNQSYSKHPMLNIGPQTGSSTC